MNTKMKFWAIMLLVAALGVVGIGGGIISAQNSDQNSDASRLPESLIVHDGGVVNIYYGQNSPVTPNSPADQALGGNTLGTLGVGTTTPITTSVQADIYGNLILSGPDRYLNFDYTGGTSGYGFRDNNGTMQFKDASGAWSTFTTAVSSDVFAVDSSNRWMYPRNNVDGVPYVVTAGGANGTSTYAGTDNNTYLFMNGAGNSSVFEGDVVVGSGARIGIGSSGGHITAQANDSLLVEGEAEFDGIVWFDGSLRASSTLMVTGASTLTGNVAALGTLAVTGASTLTGAVTASDTLAVTGAVTLSSTLELGGNASTTGSAVIRTANIDSTTGAISFSNENLTTTGTLAAGNTTITGTITGSGDLAINTSDLFVDVSADRIGIGTTTPSATLEIETTDGDSAFKIASSTSVATHETWLNINSIGDFIYDTNTIFGDRSANRVGVGSTTPQYTLSVTSASETQLGIGYNDSNYTTLAVNSSGNLDINPSGGEVGIASSTPWAQLSIGSGLSTASSTISMGKFCLFAYQENGVAVYIRLNGNAANNQPFATSTTSCL